MKNIQSIALGIVLSAILSATSIEGHHSLGTYDQMRTVTIKGTIMRIEWMNPHVLVTLTVKNPDGTTSQQRIEIAPPNGLSRRGFDRGYFQPGDAVSFEAWMPKDSRFGQAPNGRTVTLADGRSADVADRWPK
jgi:hypothetical protein